MNNKEEEYENHIKESWNFAQETIKSLDIEGHIAANATLIIFEKRVSPYHYYLKNTSGESKEEKPTEKQITYAKKLGIDNPESYTKKTLSEKIDGVKRSG